MPLTWLAVALGGALGALARYGLSGWMHAATGWLFPIGTLTVNLAGSFLLGLLLQATTERYLMAPELRLALTTGLCGSLTTFSTFSYETLVLLEEQQWAAAGLNTVLNLVLCLGAVFLGQVTGRAV